MECVNSELAHSQMMTSVITLRSHLTHDGVGLRWCHAEAALENRQKTPNACSENNEERVIIFGTSAEAYGQLRSASNRKTAAITARQ